MLTQKDLQAIDRLVQKRVEFSEKRMIKYMDKRFKETHKEFTKLFNFLDRDVVKLEDRIERLEKRASFH